MAFYQKYRAKKFGEMIGQEHIMATILESLRSGKESHAYLLTGPRGIGKTSTARLLAKALNCKKRGSEGWGGEPCEKCDSCQAIGENRCLDVVEIDAASHTSVDDVRELIDKARLAPSSAKFKVYIIDEVHMLSKNAFNALLKTLEEPPGHVVFILATTEVRKIPATILSRAMRFDFYRATKEEIIENLKRIAKTENIKIDESSLDLIAVSAAGGHRDAVGLLEKVAAAGGEISIGKTRKILGVSESKEVFLFVEAIFNNYPEEGLKIVHKLYDSGLDMEEFNKSVVELLRRLLLLSVSKQILFEDTGENLAKMNKLVEGRETAFITVLIRIFIDANAMMREATLPVLPIEIAIVRACCIQEGTANKVDDKPDVKEGATNKVNDEHDVKEEATNKVNDEPEKKNSEPEKKVEVEESETEPVAVFQMTGDIWQTVVDKVKAENATLAALLRDAKPTGMTDKTLNLTVRFSFHKDRISEPKHSATLEKIVAQVTGKDLRVVCKTAERGVKKASEGGEDLEKAVGEVFELA